MNKSKDSFPPNKIYSISGGKGTYHAFRDCPALARTADHRIVERMSYLEDRLLGIGGKPCTKCMDRWASGSRP